MNHHPSKELLGKMTACVSRIEKILRDPTQTAEVQIADVITYCWAMVELAQKLQAAVFNDLSDTE